jgi:hypothetical protein
MGGRFVAIALVALVGLSVVALAGAILWSGGQIAMAPADTAGVAGGRIAASTGRWVVNVVAHPDAGRTVEAELQIVDRQGGSAPDDLPVQAALVMVGHPMPPTPTRVERTGPGSYRIRGTVSMAGAWHIRLKLPDGTIEIPVTVSDAR